MKEIAEETKREDTEESVEGIEEQAEELIKLDAAMKKEEKKAGGKSALVRLYGKQRYKMTAPFKWEDTTYDELEFDFLGLTGADMEAIDDELMMMRVNVPVPSQSRKYQKMLAARAAHIPSDVIEHMPLADYNAITGMARNFLFITG